MGIHVGTVTLNYSAWRIPVRFADVKGGKLVPGRGKAILQRASLTALWPLFMEIRVVRDPVGRKVREGDISKVMATPIVLSSFGEARLAEGFRARVGLLDILKDAGFNPRSGMAIGTFIQILSGLGYNADNELTIIDSMRPKSERMPLAECSDMLALSKAIHESATLQDVFRLIHLMKFLTENPRTATYVNSDRDNSMTYWLTKAHKDEPAPDLKERWMSAIKGEGAAGVAKLYGGLVLPDRLRFAPLIRGTNPDVYENVVLPDLIGAV